MPEELSEQMVGQVRRGRVLKSQCRRQRQPGGARQAAAELDGGERIERLVPERDGGPYPVGIPMPQYLCGLLTHQCQEQCPAFFLRSSE
ncbi:hypothetical protein GCM10010245_87730 [Streptomyces spectabilis]|nr:hypothetical protein GCM10010245_87730 [Streptomyces spectabilis]